MDTILIVQLTPGMLAAARAHGTNIARVAACIAGKLVLPVTNVAPSPVMRTPLRDDAMERAASVGAAKAPRG